MEKDISSKTAIFVPLEDNLVASAWRLSMQAGWNQLPADWKRLKSLNPEGVKVWVDEGEVRASYSIVSHGRQVAWIGMILVDEDYRGRGLGKIAFAQALKDAKVAGFEVLGLDATDLGEPIYRKFGFDSIGQIVRWQGTLEKIGPAAAPLKWDLHPGILNYDRELMELDRQEFLEGLSNDCHFFSLNEGEKTTAYAAVREGRTAIQVGPVTARSPEHFAKIWSALAESYHGRQVICDVLEEAAGEILTRHGLKPARFLKRMTAPRQDYCLSGAGVWCAAGFELG